MAMLRPSTYNTPQKAGAAAALVLVFVVIAIHNPFFGYNTGYEDGSFLDWESNGALSVYLKPIKAALGFSMLIVVFCLAWLWLFEGPGLRPEVKAPEQTEERKP